MKTLLAALVLGLVVGGGLAAWQVWNGYEPSDLGSVVDDVEGALDGADDPSADDDASTPGGDGDASTDAASDADRAEAEQAREEAEQAADAGRFGEAAAALERAARLDPSSADADRQRARTYAVWQAMLDDHRGEIPDDLVVLHFKNGRVREAVLLDETSAGLRVRWGAGTIATFPPDLFDRVERLSADQARERRRAEIRDRLAALRADAGPDGLDGVDVFRLAAAAAEAGLHDELRPLMELALEHEPDLPAAVADREAQDLYQETMMFLALDYDSRARRRYLELKREHPRSRWYRLAAEAMGEPVALADAGGDAGADGGGDDGGDPGGDDGGADDGGAVDPGGDGGGDPPTRVESDAGRRALAAMEAGRDYFKQFFADNSDYDLLDRAFEKFNEAEKLFEQALAAEPGNGTLRQAQADNRFLKGQCNKMRR